MDFANEKQLGDEEDDSSEGEDLLGEDTPSEETDSHTSHISPESAAPSPAGAIIPPLSAVSLHSPQISQPPPPQSTITPTTTTTTELRARNPTTSALRAELLTPAATSTGISTATTEALLTHNRTEQESLTSSLLNMASALKASSQAFSSSLESEKTVLDSATSGLDKNELGLEAAQRRMGLLRRMSEGKGWWGRMVMYAWIALLMVIALVIVFVLPKFRF
jgi:Membrane fusion protein Use1